MAVYKSNGTGSTLPTNLGISERNLYGSSRLGLVTFNQNIKGTPPSQTQTTPYKSSLVRGNKFYELSNHLGNVLVTISDQKKGHTTDGVTNDYYNADIVTANDYYPFGSTMPGRSSGSYRYGFNGKEKDKDGTTTAIQYDYGARIYDPHLGRFKSVDPLIKSYPWYSPYQFAGNKPITFVDKDGLEEARPDEIINAILSPIDATYVKINTQKAFNLAQKSNLPNPADGKQDAFRHAIWNAMNSRDIGADDTAPFTTLHETGSNANNPNSQEYDPIAVKMDLHNNAVGRRIGAAHPNATDEELAEYTQQSLANGELLEIKMATFNISVLDAKGKTISQPIVLPVSLKGNPITTNQNLINILQNNNYSVEGNISKVLQPSSNPNVSPNNDKTPPLGSGYGGKGGTNEKIELKKPTSDHTRVVKLHNKPIK